MFNGHSRFRDNQDYSCCINEIWPIRQLSGGIIPIPRCELNIPIDVTARGKTVDNRVGTNVTSVVATAVSIVFAITAVDVKADENAVVTDRLVRVAQYVDSLPAEDLPTPYAEALIAPDGIVPPEKPPESSIDVRPSV